MRILRPGAFSQSERTADAEPRQGFYAGRMGIFRQSAWHVILGGLSLVFALPLLWMLSSALKRNEEIFTIPVEWFPEDFL